jgi:DNA polymerase III delta prime subunit
MEVETLLERSLHNRVYIIPEQDKNSNQVEHPWSIDVKSGSKPKVRLPQNTHIINVFDKSGIDGRLLILGQPGAGKTTMLLELAQKLVERAENDSNEPIPILLSLSSWQNDQQSIKDWIVAELSSGKYYNVRKDIAKQFLKEKEIIPLLDGLDELAASRQEQCVKKLNEFLQPGNWIYPLVVCSRIEEYQLYSTQLALNTSLELQPFSDEQIQEYMRRIGNEQLGDSIRDDRELKQLAQTPLLLNIIVISCHEISLDKWQELKSSEERLDYLFSTYVEVMLGRRYTGKCPIHEKTKRWLGWLACNLIEQNQTEFFIEKMQPSLLKNRRYKEIYRLIFGPSKEIRTSEILHFNWKILQRKLASGLAFGLAFGLMEWLTFGLISSLIKWLALGLAAGMLAGLIYRMIEMMSEGLESSEIETRTSPNQGLWRSFQNAMVLGLIAGLIVGLICGMIAGSEGLFVGLLIGLIIGMGNGGNACIEHFILRLILYSNGHIPWNYAQFLDYATDRLFLQRVGGGYRFMHDLLRQHFAANYR